MALFDKMKSPVFIKEESDTRLYIEKLQELKNQGSTELEKKIDRELKIATSGLFGEDNIAFELKHCDMPIYILRDLHIKCEDVSAQIDFAVVTKKFTLFIECKNLIGNIDVDKKGNFIRTYEYNRKKIREGIYSPITQNQRHLDVMKKLTISSQSNKLMEFAASKFFDGLYKSVVVLANPKTVLNDRYAPKNVKDKVIRADQLNTYIKNLYNESKEPASSEKHHLLTAESLLDKHVPNETDYIKKYYEILAQEKSAVNNNEISKPINISDSNNSNSSTSDKLYIALKQYRLDTSRTENIKPYFIFNNKQLEHLIEVSPTSIDELLTVNGFGPAKTEKYGQAILEIISTLG